MEILNSFPWEIFCCIEAFYNLSEGSLIKTPKRNTITADAAIITSTEPNIFRKRKSSSITSHIPKMAMTAKIKTKPMKK
jgi:hypothetical protein